MSMEQAYLGQLLQILLQYLHITKLSLGQEYNIVMVVKQKKESFSSGSAHVEKIVSSGVVAVFI